MNPAEPDLPRQLRHRLHALAELAGQEEATSAFVAEHLATCAPDRLLTGQSGHGVLAVFEGTAPGPSLLLRAELDALPIPETLDLDYASFSPEVSHKCGHDGHLAILLALAARLRAEPPATGRVMLLFQPAEETGAGAAALLADGTFDQLRPDWIFALHNLPGYPVNTVLVAPGPFCAASSGIEITLTGKTRHAAHPEIGLNLDRAMARLVLDLINLPDLLPGHDHRALVTIVHSRPGRPAFGIFPSVATILATLSADQDAVLTLLKKDARRLVDAAALAENLEWSVSFRDEFPAVVNDPHAVDAVCRAARDLGLPLAAPQESPFRWSEDFGRLAALGRGALIGLGSGLDHPVLHAQDYDFNDALLPAGTALLLRICHRITNGEMLK